MQAVALAALHGAAEFSATLTESMSAERVVRQGDVHWIAAEALRPSVPGVPHPHVVIQADILNQSRIPTTVVCALTSNLKRAEEPGNVLLEAREANLPHASVAVVSRVSTVDKAALGAPLGRLSHERVEQILAGMSFLEKSFFARAEPATHADGPERFGEKLGQNEPELAAAVNETSEAIASHRESKKPPR
jgi:mRNA interferase MazF